MDGTGVTKDYDQSAQWYLKAAEQGFPPAQSNLGIMYALGWGVPKDYVEAYKWYFIALAQGFDLAQEGLNIVAKKMTSADIAKAERVAKEWLSKHRQAIAQ